MPELMSQAEYARHRDCSRQYVSKLIKKGVLSLNDDKKIDKEVADKILDDIADPARVRPTAPEDDNETQAAGSVTNDSFAKAKAMREAYNAKTAQLDYEERAKQLVRKSEVQDAAFELARGVRDELLSLPGTISGQLVSMRDEKQIAAFLKEKLSEVLTALCEKVKEDVSTSE
mgnify:CR=1 FL=1|tara:strand:+ start:479 stop:997 length:519 start_codon:yes stop_codon:yes gene_type:complete